MSLTYEEVEKRIKELIEWRRNLPSITERTPRISEILFREFFFDKNGEDQERFKESLTDILCRQANIHGETADAIIAHVFYVCLKIQVPLSERLIELLQKGDLNNRTYEDRNLGLLALTVLGDLPPKPSTSKSLGTLFDGWKDRIDYSYCNHFMNVFARHDANEGVHKVLDRLLNLNLNEEQARKVGFQFVIAFEHLSEPVVIRKWFERVVSQIHHNWLNESFNTFVKIARGQPDYYGDKWLATLEALETFAGFYSPLQSRPDQMRIVEYRRAIDSIKERHAGELDTGFEEAAKVGFEEIRLSSNTYRTLRDMVPNFGGDPYEETPKTMSQHA